MDFAILVISQKTEDRVEKFNEIGRKKKAVSLQSLGKGFPVEFVKLIEYARNLEFDERPNYGECREMLRKLFQKRGCKADGRYDWDRQGMVC